LKILVLGDRAAAAKKIAESGDDKLVMGEFSNDEDAELSW
jgi:hypothetical protein